MGTFCDRVTEIVPKLCPRSFDKGVYNGGQEMKDFNLQWVLPGILARSCRPCYNDDASSVLLINQWLDEVASMKIKSILCLLSQEQLDEFYGVNGIKLLDIYRTHGFIVGHVPVPDYQMPPLGGSDLALIEKVLAGLPKPWLIHCSAGIDRTGAAVEFIQNHVLNNGHKRK